MLVAPQPSNLWTHKTNTYDQSCGGGIGLGDSQVDRAEIAVLHVGPPLTSIWAVDAKAEISTREAPPQLCIQNRRIECPAFYLSLSTCPMCISK